MNNTIPNAQRKLTPDLARGFMLLFIALAHANLFLFSSDREITVTDQITVFFRQLFIDSRAFPLFAILFGYGLHKLYTRQEMKGAPWRETKKILKRRGGWMLVIGFLHAALFFEDIIGVYGLIALVFAGVLLRLSNREMVVVTSILLIVVGVIAPFMPRAYETLNMAGAGIAVMENPLEASLIRIYEWIFYTPSLSYQYVPGVLIGILLGRAGFLDNPENHQKTLRKVALIGLLLSIAGAIPIALRSSLFWSGNGEIAVAAAKNLHITTGYAGGAGWTALIGLAVVRLEGKQGSFVSAIAALGQRSLSFYLFQSVMFVLILAPYAGGLGGHMGQLGSDLIALLVWILSVLLAALLAGKSMRGPFESFLRMKSKIS
ncbi:DUF418 domain-containing protein [Rossellomorea aquimaris]|uniref:DUF418 domain-containing protein n=1 Tax=Rossellomorea aquimaris TaxID=189382 RepID=A0A5D4TL24_9BACI|nr:DUF418 domain-containing protein [Rossellomorea aquimaris]TYS75491.1 DUF418 domain-containing protein [Rossellomorea aquimaris]